MTFPLAVHAHGQPNQQRPPAVPPTSASWLNAVEGWFSQLERRVIYRGVFTSVTALKDELRRFIRVHNAVLAKPFKWTKSAKAIIESVQRAKESAGINGTN